MSKLQHQDACNIIRHCLFDFRYLCHDHVALCQLKFNFQVLYHIKYCVLSSFDDLSF